MKLLHTADWHLGKKLEQFGRLNEQRDVMDELVRITEEHEVDAVIIAGDLYDNFNPATEAVELFYQTLKRLSGNGRRPVIAIAGNHDSPDRIEVSDPLARACGIILVGHPITQVQPFSMDTGWKVQHSESGFLEVSWNRYDYPLRVIHTPFANEYRLKTFLGIENSEAKLREVLQTHWQFLADRYCDEKGVNILMTHLFIAASEKDVIEEPEGEKPVAVGNAQIVYSRNLPDNIQYAALGHLHRHQVIRGRDYPVVYSSSPLAYSFSEAGQTKYAVLVEAGPGTEASFTPIALSKGKKLFRKKFSNIEEALTWLKENPDCLVEITLMMDEYLSSTDRKRLYGAHNGIVSLIPELHGSLGTNRTQRENITLDKSMTELFSDYFMFREGQKPSQELIQLFKEIQAQRK